LNRTIHAARAAAATDNRSGLSNKLSNYQAVLLSLTPYQSHYIAWQLSRRMGADSADTLASTLVDAHVDLNPHRLDESSLEQRASSGSTRDENTMPLSSSHGIWPHP